MASPSASRLRAFVRRTTRLADVPDVPGVRLYLSDDVMAMLRLTGAELGQDDPPLPYWAFAWTGGLAVARYLIEHQEEVAGKRVVDMASGSGLCAIVALKVGATSVAAIDIDPFAAAAVDLNAKANDVRIGFTGADVLDEPPPDCDVILAGDICYEETMANRMVDWLREAARGGTRVLIGDPGRRYLPRDLELVATYQVRTSREIEATTTRRSAVYSIGRGA